MTNMWGVHNDTLATELIDGGFVSIGWDALDFDLTSIGSSRDDLKSVLSGTFPNRKPGAIAGWAGILHRFVYQMKPGDVVVAPYKPDSTINIGVVVGDYQFVADAPTHRHRRPIQWSKLGVPRTVFTQPALYGNVVDPETKVFLGTLEVDAEQQLHGGLAWNLLELYNDVVREEGRGSGVLVVDLAAELPKDSRLFYDFVHFNNDGSAAVAKIVAAHLCPYLASRYPAHVAAECPATITP